MIFPWGRALLMGALLGLATPLWLTLLLRLGTALTLEIGPGDRDHRQGLHQDFRVEENEGCWREMGRRARLHLPVTLEGPGTLRLKLVQPGPDPVRLRIDLDEGAPRELTIRGDPRPQEVSLSLPPQRLRANLRLRSEGSDGGPGRLRLYRAEWEGEGVRPQRGPVRKAALLMVVSFAALALAGLSLWQAFAVSLSLPSLLTLLGAVDPHAALHLIDREAAVAVTGLAAIALLRWVRPATGAGLFCLFYAALLSKSALLFHPRYYFVDLPIHETLLELVYHRGVIDFWTRLPDYQVIHNLGVAPVGGIAQPFPYPVMFYCIAHLGNLLVTHQPELWLKLTASLLSALALFPLGAMAKRLTPLAGAELFAAAAYLFLPGITRALLLMELSALTGHLFDLLLLAFLAGVSLTIDSWRRMVVAGAGIAIACAAYTGGFLHQGLLVGSSILFLEIAGAPRSHAYRLALAGIGGAVVALLCYHPRTLSILFSSVLVAGVAAPSGTASIPFVEQLSSALHRIPVFLGWVLPPVGVWAFVGLTRGGSWEKHRWIAAWALAGTLAYSMRYVLVDLMRYQKELYWLGALLATTSGGLLAALARRNIGARARGLLVGILLAMAAAWWWELSKLLPRFYRDYLFL